MVVKAKQKKNSPDAKKGIENALVDEKLTKRIMKTVQSQARQENSTNAPENSGEGAEGMKPLSWADLTGEQNAINLPQTLGDDEGDKLTEKQDIQPIVAEEDEKALEMFFTSEQSKRGIDLNAMIKERLGLVNEMIPDDDDQMGGNDDIANLCDKSQLQPELASLFVH